MKKKKSMALPILLIIGLSFLLYPTLSNYWNAQHQSRAIAGYQEAVAEIDQEDYDAILNAALEYNQSINRLTVGALADTEQEMYENLLNVSGNGIMGYIKIPAINCTLPIYHGTDDSVLQIAVGHLEGSSLPVGGAGTHCVLSGHRGLPNARLFTNLDQLIVGDSFTLAVLDEEYIYEVDQISIVNPEDVSCLTFEEGQDLCTLVTCTPYGVNSHRLLVRGHRVETAGETVLRVTADATQISNYWVTAIASIPLLLGLLIRQIVRRCRRR